MTPDHLIAFNAILLVAILSPGAAFLFALRSAVADGRMAGIAAGAGLASMAAAWTLAALLGLDGLFRLFPTAYTLLKIAGALYLLVLALKTWRGAGAPITSSRKPKGRAYVDGVLINLANPKSVLFSAAVLIVVFPEDLRASDIALITFNHFAVELICYTLFALLLSSAPARTRYLAAKPNLDRIAALVLGAFGLKLLTDR
jgi:threonine/homoserine/homoserine lactone efflux protein